jgi:hypothetical protein
MFVGSHAEYMPKSYQVDDEENRLLNSVRNDDVIILTKYPFPNQNFREGLEGQKLINFLKCLEKNGAIVAYVTQA